MLNRWSSKEKTLRAKKITIIIALVPGDKKVDEKNLSKVCGSELKLASPQKVKKRTGCDVGSVPPFGFEDEMETYMDKGILNHEKINFSAAMHTKSVQMNPEDLKKITRAKECRIAEKVIKTGLPLSFIWNFLLV